MAYGEASSHASWLRYEHSLIDVEIQIIKVKINVDYALR